MGKLKHGLAHWTHHDPWYTQRSTAVCRPLFSPSHTITHGLRHTPWYRPRFSPYFIPRRNPWVTPRLSRWDYLTHGIYYDKPTMTGHGHGHDRSCTRPWPLIMDASMTTCMAVHDRVHDRPWTVMGKPWSIMHAAMSNHHGRVHNRVHGRL